MIRQAASVLLVLIVCVLPSAAQPPKASPEADPTEGPTEGESTANDRRPSPALMIRGWPAAFLGRLVPEGMKYSVAASAFFEHQTSLENTLARTTVTLRDVDTNAMGTTVFEEDPKLTNTKLDFDLELKGVGAQVPLGLPQIPGTGVVSIYPTLLFELSAVDVGFDVLHAAPPTPPLGAFEAATLDAGFDAFAVSQALSSSSQGSGPMLGLGLDLTARVCTYCKWIVNGSYWYRFIPGLDVERPRSLFPELDVVFDSLSLSREAHEVSARAGHAVSAGTRRYVPFMGVLYRKTKLELEDEVQFGDPAGLETSLKAFSRFDSETVQALVGFDVQLSRSVFGRFETSFGEGDYGVSLQVLWGKETKFVGKLKEKVIERRYEKADKRTERRFKKTDKRIDKLAPQILLRLKEVEARYRREWAGLAIVAGPGGQPAYVEADVESLLARTKDDILEVLSRPALAPLHDFVMDFHHRAVAQMNSSSVKRDAWPPLPVLAKSQGDPGLFTVRLTRNEEEHTPLFERVLRLFGNIFPVLDSALENKECRSVNVTFSVSPDSDEVSIAISSYYSRKNSSLMPIKAGSGPRPIHRGTYRYDISRPGNPVLSCPTDLECPLNLVEWPCPKFACSLAPPPSVKSCTISGKVELKPECGPEVDNCPLN